MKNVVIIVVLFLIAFVSGITLHYLFYKNSASMLVYRVPGSEATVNDDEKSAAMACAVQFNGVEEGRLKGNVEGCEIKMSFLGSDVDIQSDGSFEFDLEQNN